MPRCIMLVAIKPALVRPLKRFLTGLGFDSVEIDAISYFHRTSLYSDAVLVGLSSDDREQPLALARVHQERPGLPVIALAEGSSEALAITALRAGVRDYLKCPISWSDLEASLRRALPGSLDAQPSSDPVETAGLVGSSSAFVQVRQQIRKLASINSNVLITGETGTGKELVAQSIHRLSPRSKCPFISVNCAAIPDALL